MLQLPVFYRKKKPNFSSCVTNSPHCICISLTGSSLTKLKPLCNNPLGYSYQTVCILWARRRSNSFLSYARWLDVVLEN